MSSQTQTQIQTPTKFQLEKLLEITEETHKCIENQMKLLKQFLDRTEGAGESTSPNNSKQTTIDEHFKKTIHTKSESNKEIDWCMVENNTPKKPVDKETPNKSPLRRSTRNRQPPKRMDGILTGDEMYKQMDKVDKFNLFDLSFTYSTNKKYLKNNFANYDTVNSLLEAIPDCSETQEHGYMTFDNFKTTLSRLYILTHSTPPSSGFFKDCSSLFNVLVEPNNNIQEPVVRMLDLMIALMVLFKSNIDNLETIYEIFDFNQITHLYYEELKQLLTIVYKTMCWIHGKEMDTQPLVNDTLEKLDCVDEYSIIGYDKLNEFFENKF